MRAKLNGILTLLLVLSVQFVFAQKTVSGTVSDEAGPLPGVNVIIKGTKTGVETDFDGKYSIQAKQGDVLQFSYIGMEMTEKTVGSSNVIDVLMTSANVLDEVVVTAFGRKKSKNEFTGNAVNVDSEQIKKTSFVSTEQALQGKVAGLRVNTTSGTPGSTQQISIRGLQSINASNDPLIIIDGVAINQSNLSGSTDVSTLSPLSSLKTDDIESITVLKDAISTAPYGPAGSNGVIMITTKNGKQGQTKYNLSSSVGYINNASRGLKPMTGQQKLELLEESVWNTYGSSSYGGLGYISTRDEVEDFMSYYSTFANANNWIAEGKPFYDWEKEIVNKNASMINTDFSVSQGNEKSNLYASLGYNKTESTVIGSDFSRVSGLIKYKTDLSDKIQLSISVNGANSIQNASLEQAAYFSNPNLTKYFMSPWVNPYEEDGTPNITSLEYQTSIHNVLYTATQNIRRNDVTRLAQGTELKISLLKNLSFKTNFNIEYNSAYYKNYENPYHGDGEDYNGYVEESVERVFDYTTQNSLDYNFKIGEDHTFALTGLMEFIKFKNNYLYAYGENFPNDILENLSAASSNYDAYSSFSDRMTLRYVGMLNYNYKGKYLLDGTYSYQGDSRFSEDVRFDNFYSVGLGWNIHKEDFMQNINFINELRLKAGYGITGNYGINRNVYQAGFSFYEYNSNPATYISGYGTTASWEKGLKRDIALEYRMMDGRLKGTFAYFSNKTYDMLFDKPLPMSSTYVPGSAIQNVGEMTNKGFEADLSFDVIRKEKFNWNVSGNYATLDNMVTKLPEDASIVTGTRIVEQDRILYEWYLPLWKGVDPDNGLPVWYTDETKTATTNIYAEASRVYTGFNAMPKYSGGLSTRFDISNFFVEGGIYFSGGNKVYEDWAAYTHTSRGNVLNFYNASTELYDNVWRNPGDIATHPRMEYSNSIITNAANASTRWLYDGDYIRLRDLAIGYKLTKSQFDSLPFESVILSARGTNLFTWVKDDRLKWDPEVRTDGFTNLTTPPVKTVVINLNINF